MGKGHRPGLGVPEMSHLQGKAFRESQVLNELELYREKGSWSCNLTEAT